MMSAPESSRSTLPGHLLPSADEAEKADHGRAVQQADCVGKGEQGAPAPGEAMDAPAERGHVEDHLRDQRPAVQGQRRQADAGPEYGGEKQRVQQAQELVGKGLDEETIVERAQEPRLAREELEVPGEGANLA